MSKYFKKHELECHCGCGAENMEPFFMRKLAMLREAYDKPIVLNSAYRCPKHNKSIGGGPAHVSGRGVDISVYGSDAFQLIALAINCGFTGIGVKQHGDGRFIHLDTLEPGKYVSSPRPWIWSYK